RIALRQRRRLLFLGGQLLGGFRALLEIGRRTVPPLRVCARKVQRHTTCESGHEKRGCTRTDQDNIPPKRAAKIATNCYHNAASGISGRAILGCGPGDFCLTCRVFRPSRSNASVSLTKSAGSVFVENRAKS